MVADGFDDDNVCFEAILISHPKMYWRVLVWDANGQRFVLVGGNGFQTVMAHVFPRSFSDCDLPAVTLSVLLFAVLVSFLLLRYLFF
jgi:hypothetical protein